MPMMKRADHTESTENLEKRRCTACRSDVAVPNFTMAFQPIVDIETAAVYAYEGG